MKRVDYIERLMVKAERSLRMIMPSIFVTLYSGANGSTFLVSGTTWLDPLFFTGWIGACPC